MKPHAAPRGITLIELTVAMAVFALVAVMGLQALTGMLRHRDHVAETHSRTGELSVGLALLRNDLSAAVPRLFSPPGGGKQSSLVWDDGPQSLSMSTAGHSDLAPAQSLGLQRVTWRLDKNRNQLFRSSWPLLTPADTNARTPETLYLTDVSDIEIRSFWTGFGWVVGVASPDDAPTTKPVSTDGDGGGGVAASHSDQLPLALEITLSFSNGHSYRLIEAFQ